MKNNMGSSGLRENVILTKITLTTDGIQNICKKWHIAPKGGITSPGAAPYLPVLLV